MASESVKGTILVATGPWDPVPWAKAIGGLLPDHPVAIWPQVPDPAAVRYLMAWKPPAESYRGLPNLAAIFSLGAGVDHIVFQPSLPAVPIVRIVDPDLTARMTEWVTLQVLLHHRRQREYDRLQRARTWHELRQPAASEVRVGIMGLGVLGRDAAAVLARLGFAVAGWSRTPAIIAGIQSFHGMGQLEPFLARTDILVCLLPLTRETRGILSMRLFRRLARNGALPRGPVLVNAGRGGLQVEADIVEAMTTGVLAGASLDVFEVEPLPPDSPLWGLDDVVITPHSAGWSSPAVLTAQIAGQIRAFEAGDPLRNIVDPGAMY